MDVDFNFPYSFEHLAKELKKKIFIESKESIYKICLVVSLRQACVNANFFVL
jgi:hypothetical protein